MRFSRSSAPACRLYRSARFAESSAIRFETVPLFRIFTATNSRTMETIPLFGPYALRRLRTRRARTHLRLDRHPTPPPGPLAPVRGRHAPDRADPAGGGRNARRHGQSGLHAPQRQRLCGTDRLQIGRRRQAQRRDRLLAARGAAGQGDHDGRRADALRPCVRGRWACGVSRSAAARATSRATAFRSVSASSAAMSSYRANSSPTESGSTPERPRCWNAENQMVSAPASPANPVRSGPMPYAATSPMTPCAVHPASHRKKETCGEVSFSSFSSVAAGGPISS